MEGRSAWTGKMVGTLIEVRLPVVNRFGGPGGEKAFLVEPKHEAELRRWVAYVNRNARRFLGLVLGISAIQVAFAFLTPAWEGAYRVTIALLIPLGLTILVFPFSTPETVEMMGMQRARTLGRAAGLLLIAMGALILPLFR